MSVPVLEPKTSDPGVGSGRWMTVIFNNDHTPMDDVIAILIEATGCGFEEAAIETWEAHHYGQAPVHFASRHECERAAEIISRIGVATEVTLEWAESA